MRVTYFIISTRIGGLLPFSNLIFILTKSKFHQTMKQKILQSFLTLQMFSFGNLESCNNHSDFLTFWLEWNAYDPQQNNDNKGFDMYKYMQAVITLQNKYTHEKLVNPMFQQLPFSSSLFSMKFVLKPQT